jgi:O-antigen ligase
MDSTETVRFDAAPPDGGSPSGSAAPLVGLDERAVRRVCGVRNGPKAVVTALLTTAAAGYLLAWMAGRFGDRSPLVLAALVIVPLVLYFVAPRPRLAVAGVFLLFPIGGRSVIGPVDVIGLAVMVVAGLLLLTRRVGAPRRKLQAPVWWLVALLGWSVLAVPSALDKSLAFRQVGMLGLGLVFLFAVVTVCRSHDDIRRVIPAFLIVMVAGAATSIATMNQVQAGSGGSIVSGRALGFFGEPNSFGLLCMMASLLAFAFAVGAARGPWRLVAALAGLVVLAGLVLSFSRGAWIGFALGLVVLALNLGQARRALVFCAVGLVAVTVGLATFIPQPPQVEVAGERLRSIVGERNPYDDRPHVWAEAGREIVARPIFGYGPANFREASRRATSEGRTAFAFHAHNVLLTWGAEAGLPAVVLLVGLTLHVARVARRARRQAVAAGRWQDAALVTGLSAALVGVAGQELFDYNIGHPVMLCAVLAMVGFLLAAASVEVESQVHRQF